MTAHELKTLPTYFEALADGRRSFEVRRDDRGFEVGDLLRLREWSGTDYTGREMTRRVVYLTYYGSDAGFNDIDLKPFVVLGLDRLDALSANEGRVRARALEEAAKECDEEAEARRYRADHLLPGDEARGPMDQASVQLTKSVTASKLAIRIRALIEASPSPAPGDPWVDAGFTAGAGWKIGEAPATSDKGDDENAR